MTIPSLPATTRAWTYTSISPGLEHTLTLSSSLRLPIPKSNEHLVRVLAMSLNPLDYKPAETPFFHRFLVPKPATPGTDFCGRIVKPADGSGLKEGQLIFGVSSKQIFAGKALAEYAAVPVASTVAVPERLSLHEAAGIPVAGLTGYQSVMPFVKEGSRVFINGGSGGTGIFAIQIARIIGAHVTVSCSAANAELCKSLGADEVVDYRSRDVVTAMKEIAKDVRPFDVIIDNVGSDYSFFFQVQDSITRNGRFIMVAGSPSIAFVGLMLKVKALPAFLGGAKRKFELIVTDANRPQEYRQLAQWVVEKKVRIVVDSTFAFEDAREAMRKLKSQRARGKVLVDVAGSGAE